MSLINSDMINVRLGSDNNLTLSEFLMSGVSGGSIPISLFGKTVSSSLISEAIAFLKGVGGGSVIIPPSDTYGTLKIVVRKNKIGNFITKFEYNFYRYPINAESRPYTGGSWEVGDIVYNSDFENSDDKCMGWVCTESGIPGKWSRYGGDESQSIETILNRINRTLVIKLRASAWSPTAPYTQKVYDSDITEDDYPIVSYYIEEGSSAERILEVKDAFSCIDDGTTYNGYIEFLCASEKPTVDFDVILRGV